jgi:hypothetical protein
LRKLVLHFVSSFALIFLASLAAQAQESFSPYEKEFTAARQSILDGHAKDGIGQMVALLTKIDPVKEPNNYWLLSVNLADFLHQTENYQDESTILNQLIAKNLHNSNPLIAQQTAVRIGRTLAFTGHANDGQKVLRDATGEDARLVLTPPQREAARVLSRIELDRGNVSQAAIWMRRAVVGALVDKGASSEEIVDTLTDYATYLRRTREVFQSYDLLSKLVPTYDQSFPHRSPKYLHFASELLESARSVGNFAAAANIYKILKENADAAGRSHFFFLSVVAGGRPRSRREVRFEPARRKTNRFNRRI